MKRHIILRHLVELDAKIKGKKTEFGLASVAGGVIGGQVGRSLSGKKWNPQTNRWEDDEGNQTSAPIGSVAAGTAVGAALPYAHAAVMKNYGGAGGVKQAYTNVARNIGASATEAGSDALDLIKKKLSALKGLVPRFSEGQTERLVELTRKLEAIGFDKKHNEAEATPIGPQPTHGRRNAFTGGLAAGLATAGAVKTVRGAGGLAGIARKMKAARAATRTGSYVYRSMA